jgi:hypothetical protein
VFSLVKNNSQKNDEGGEGHSYKKIIKYPASLLINLPGTICIA